ncbi:MAG: MATE family efflux transporter [Aureispira sp.]|nr:MATE family efflux transporter [Aureispira sp.]
MTTYRDILKLSIPIMIGSAVQNLITLTDTIFLGRVGEVELGAIGLVGVFYLMIASIGYSFSKAGQIMIARRVGEGDLEKIGVITYSMGAFALFLATILFFFMQFGSRWFFGLFVDSQEIYEACIAYLDYRSIGVFFSYIGVVAIALYTGVARTTVIIYNALMMGVSNMVLNYGLIFGEWGFPEMGIAGAGLASTIAEILATTIFIGYIILDKHSKSYKLLQLPKIDVGIIKAQLKLSTPIVLQSVVGMGSWFIFFILIEDMGKTELAISNLMRAVYLLLMIPCWGFASGTNTIVSNLIGKNKLDLVFPAVSKVALLCFVVTMICGSSLLIAPNTMLKIGTDNLFLIEESKRLIWVLLLTLALFSVGAIYFNGLVGTGATNQALVMQVISVCIYLGYLYWAVEIIHCSLEMAWMGEIYYWIATLAMAIWYLRSTRWYNIKV